MSTDILDEDTGLIQVQVYPEYVTNLINKFIGLKIGYLERGVIFKVFKSTKEMIDAFLGQKDILDLETWVWKIIAENRNK
jgi:hypothetical protein